MKIAILGGTGFIGRYLVDQLLKDGHTVQRLVRKQSTENIRGLIDITGDVNDDNSVSNLLKGADAVIYNIGIIKEDPARGVTYSQLHYRRAVAVMEAAGALGVKRFIYISAQGAKADGTDYQQTKFLAETHLSGLNLNWTIFRPSVVYGDPREGMEFCTQIYQDIVKPLIPAPYFFSGSPGSYKDFFTATPVHVKDLAELVSKTMADERAYSRIYPVGGPGKTSWFGLIQLISNAVGKDKFGIPVPLKPVRLLTRLLKNWKGLPVTADQLTMLAENNICESEHIFRMYGLSPRPFSSEQLAYLKERK